MKIKSLFTVLLGMALAAPASSQRATLAQMPAWPQGLEQSERAQEQAERLREQAERVKEQAERVKELTLRTRERDDDLYQRGAEYLDESRWEKAVSAFDQVAKRSGQRADGALYWKAYSMNKLGQRDPALLEIEALRKTYPNSRWLNDAKALAVEIQQKAGQPVKPGDDSDEELKLLAINGLMHSDPESTVPILEKFLLGNNTPKLKDRALFVLSQNHSPKALEVLSQIAHGKSNPDLQLKALRYLAMFGGKESRQMLADIYGSTTDVAVKRRILSSYMQSGDRERLFAAAKSEANPELRQEAIRLLGAQGGKEELWQLYQTETSTEIKRQIMQSLFVSGSVDRITELARSEKDHDLRLAAIRTLGIMGGSKSRQGNTGDTLVALYGTEKDTDIRKEILKALFVQGNAKGLVDIARKETDPTLKKEAVSKLSVMRSKEATDFMMEILSK